VAKELTELHHGKISVKSKINQGTIFTVFLPLGKKYFPEDIISKKHSLDNIIVPNKNRLILSEYIDDNKSIYD